MAEKEQDFTNHRWKQHHHDPMGEIDGVRCEVQVWRCEFCNEPLSLPGGVKPPDEACSKRKAVVKEKWVAPIKNKDDEEKSNEKTSSNLRALIYSPRHSSYCDVVPINNIKGLEIDHRNKTWSCNVPGFNYGNKTPLVIGQHDQSMKDYNSGVIGVYDISDNKHLTALPNDWHDIQTAKNTNWHNVD
jgi:hypothetical protein